MMKPHPISAALFLAFLVCLAHPLTAHAETKTITAEATYTMGDGETPSFAEAQVIQRAKQVALEQAGTYVESYTKVHNYDLTTEEIQTIAGGVMTFEVLDKSRELVGDGLKLSIKIKATVTTDKMEDLAQRIRGKNVAGEYQKLQAEYAKLSREVETWKQLAAKTPVGPEREAALDQIRERERAFARVQQNEAALFQRLVSGQALVAEAHDDKALIDRLIEAIKRDGHVIDIGKVRAFPSKGPHPSQDQVALTVPVRLEPSAVLPGLLSDAVRSLGGDGLVSILPLGSSYGKDFATLRFQFDPKSIEYSRVTVTTTTMTKSPPYSVPRDNLYRHDSISRSKVYEIGTPGNLVRLSRSRPLEDYFRNQVRNLVLVMELNDDGRGFRSMSCRVPFIVNRLISALDTKSELYGPRFHAQNEDKVSEDTSVLLLLFPDVNFNVEFELPSEMAVKVERVTARWMARQNAPQDVCRIIVENNIETN
jgi:hypothetical protein